MLKVLEKPIAFIDIESTGTNRDTDRIIDIAICYLSKEDDEIRGYNLRINPGIPIPHAATKIHGISDDDVKGLPSFRDRAKEILELLDGCNLGGFNSNSFDFPLLFNEFARCGIHWDYKKHLFFDAGNIFKRLAPRTLTAAVETYLGEKHEGAHGAEADTEATARVFLAQLKKHEELATMGPDELAKFCNHDKPLLDMSGKFTVNDKGEIVFTFGPNRDKPAKDHLDFLSWMLSKDFPNDTQAICREIYSKHVDYSPFD